MELVRRGDVDGFHVRVGAQPFRIFEGLGAEFFGKTLAGVGARIVCCDHPDAGIGRKCRQHQREGAAETDDTEV